MFCLPFCVFSCLFAANLSSVLRSFPMPDATPDRLDVLAVAPHPDDLEILCGGTIARLVKQGYKVGMADLTSGEPTPRGSLETRKKEAEAARVALGGPLRVNVELPNRVLMDAPENRFKL